jgi:hypothetical protein
MGARCYKVGIYSFLADNIFFLNNDVNDEMLKLNDIVRSLGPRSKALPFVHAFTGCDSVSAFVGKGKKTVWQAWNVFENATEVFNCLSSPCDNFTRR